MENKKEKSKGTTVINVHVPSDTYKKIGIIAAMNNRGLAAEALVAVERYVVGYDFFGDLKTIMDKEGFKTEETKPKKKP